MDNQDNIKNNVLGKIRRGEVKMRPKAVFVAKVAAVLAVAVLAMILAAMVASFAFFSLHQSGELFLLGFGAKGVLMLLKLFPWAALVIAVALIVAFEWLLRRFKFTYRVPILNFFGIALLLSVASGLLIAATPLHKSLLERADRDELPVLGRMYEGLRSPREDKGEFRGVVVAIGTSTITITHNDRDYDADDGTRTVLCPPGFDWSQVKVGDRVYVAGDTDAGGASGTLPAYGIRVFK